MTEHPPEFSRIVKLSDLGAAPLIGEATASDEECAALAKRFDLPSIDSLSASYELRTGTDRLSFSGRLESRLTQSCAISGDDLPVTISEDFTIAFVEIGEIRNNEEQEIELASEDCDVLEYSDNRVDIGEALAQTLFLALDPYPQGPNADKIRHSGELKTEEEAGPFAALAALKDKLG
ncbi:MAG: DUF177 domain-containing protein [Pseudomonadota bacterium]